MGVRRGWGWICRLMGEFSCVPLGKPNLVYQIDLGARQIELGVEADKVVRAERRNVNPNPRLQPYRADHSRITQRKSTSTK